MEVGKICQLKPIEHLQEMSTRLADKHPGLDLLSKIQERLDGLAAPAQLDGTTTQAIAVSLQSPAYLDGLQEEDPAFQAWKRASYEFLSQEFGQENLVYLHVSQEKPTAAIHCIFVPIASNQLAPQAFIGTSAQEQGYINRYQAVLDRLFKPEHAQVKGLQAIQAPRASQQLPSWGHRAGTQLPFQPNQGRYRAELLDEGQNRSSMVEYKFGSGHRKYEAATNELSSKSGTIHLPSQRQHVDQPVKDPAHGQGYGSNQLEKLGREEGATTYLEQRGIERATDQGISGMRTNDRAAIFGLYRKVGIQKGEGELFALEYYPKDDREIDKELQAYLPRGLSVLRPNGEIKEILITRSPINGLSHKELHKDQAAHTLYVSTCGTITKAIASNLEELLLQAKEQGVVVKLGFDNDQLGRDMAHQLTAIASKHDITCQIEWPQVGKDWNDMLLASKEQSKQLDLPKPTTGLGRGL